MSIQSNIEQIKSALPASVKLVAVSKYHPEERIIEAYESGQRCFGENKVQELDSKQKDLPTDIEWHLIGHLQTNKVRYIVPYVHTIQSVDSWKLLQEINKQASKVGRVVNCLLEIHIAEEDSKFGFTFGSCRNMLQHENWSSLANITISGVMGMATFTDNQEQIRKEFRSLKQFFVELKSDYFSDSASFCEVSMGMSHDYNIAIKEGSTIIRVGTSIFGEREY